MDLVELSGLGKRYPGSTAWSLRHVDLTIRPGEVYGLIGENGAGKTTLIRLLLGLIRPSAGRIALKPGLKLAYVPDRPAFWNTLRVNEHLAAVGRTAGLGGAKLRAAVTRVLELADLQSKARARIAALSRGMLQRLSIAAACLAGPDLVVMDEPASGLDPAGQRSIRELILTLRSRGTTILLSSHYLVELERVCTRVGVLHQGALALDRVLEELAHQYRQQVELEIDGAPEGLSDLAAELAGLELDHELDGSRLACRNLDDERYFKLTSVLGRRRLRILSLTHPGLLEQVFLDVAGGQAP